MRIMQIVPRMEIGGLERGVIDLTVYFKNRKDAGADIQNIVVSGGGRLIQELDKEGVTHHELPVYKKSLFSLFLIPKLRKIIDKEKIDIIHARSRVPGWLAFFASRGKNACYITTIHGIYKSKKSSEVMGWGKFVICPSRAVARHMKENFFVPEEKIVIVNRWVNLNKFKFIEPARRKNSNTIVSVGRISPSKGYEYLIEGFKKVVRQNPYLKLKIVGAPDKTKMEYYQHLKTLVNRFSLNHNVEFPGFRPDVENVLGDAKIAISPSVIDEAFPRAVLEACACGIPIVATEVGGVSEIIENGVNGIMVEPKNSDAIANAILKLAGDTTLADSMAQKAREKIEKLYSMEKALKETERVYRRALSLKRILVVKISSLGDIILSIPSLKALKESFPEGKISILVLKKYAPVLYGCPYVDEIITLEEDYKRLKNILATARDLRRHSFDYVLDLQNSRVSHLISFFTFPQYSFGYRRKWGFLLSKHIKYLRNLDPLSSQEKILELIGTRIKEKKLNFWDIKPGISEKFFGNEENLIGINVSASKKWLTKNWPAANIKSLIELISKNMPSYKVVLLGDSESEPLAKTIEAEMNRSINLCGKTALSELPSVIKRLKVFITPDTATLHLAQALEVPTIGLFGPTDPNRHAVKGKNLYIICKEVLCSFCYKPRCKLDKENLCMEKISAQEVFSKIKEITSPRNTATNK
ncbi:MAG: glycosyltransferase [Candidatus Omnitrophica bacterium]|nr:glycosyltransferase [Candidatus Omnitrophota bacterium]